MNSRYKCTKQVLTGRGIYEDDPCLNTRPGCLNRSVNMARLPEVASDTCQRRLQRRPNIQVPSPPHGQRGRRERMAISLPDVARFIYAGRFGHVYALLGSRRHVLGFVDCAKQARTYISRDFIKNPPTLFFPPPPPSRCCGHLLDPVVTPGNVTTGSRRCLSAPSRCLNTPSRVFKHHSV